MELSDGSLVPVVELAIKTKRSLWRQMTDPEFQDALDIIIIINDSNIGVGFDDDDDDDDVEGVLELGVNKSPPSVIWRHKDL
ncbi:hypothetical protein T265_04599 [Opisthorchis viverrini]|uniref:Uncharacterized protein n=1 Tax=Opisthorchis viverrini TaxID=6198 RepID=A0A074ZNJ2_OPIVI|nr:hypothetical protein T265_04599 [Opisthorchis viverrini]KER28651.1 hypothetical protein T265_04599 [Opisthorchis viverrini]